MSIARDIIQARICSLYEHAGISRPTDQKSPMFHCKDPGLDKSPKQAFICLS